ncbi:MAG: type II toxin-antitoxin system PemK/MazF family toxin [Tagaea sp.]
MVKPPPKRFDVVLAALDPTVGSEIRKTRPCVVVSPDVLNERLQTAIVAPLTKSVRAYPSRVGTRFGGLEGQIALDQIRSIDRSRIVKRLGVLRERDRQTVVDRLLELFAW